MGYFNMYLCFSLFQCLLLSTLYQLPQIRADYPSGGTSLEYCREKEDCAGSRTCYTAGGDYFEACNASATNCFCQYPTRATCYSSADCSDGDRCFGYEGGNPSQSGNFCWTCRLQLTESDSYVDENPSTCKDVWLGGYTGDICADVYIECAGERTCREFLEDGSTDWCSFETEPCFCWPDSLKACSSSKECENGERCAEDAKGLSACFSCGRIEADDTFKAIDKDAVCTTPSPTITGTPSSSPSASLLTTSDNDSSSSATAPLMSLLPPQAQACIAVVHLLHVEVRDLIFPDHIRAAVLCDRRDSCSTPGHLVVYNNIPMSMHSYCTKYSSCSRRIAMVNNPRMRKAFRIPSNTDGLQFTVFSARYETKLEESLLGLAISLGM